MRISGTETSTVLILTGKVTVPRYRGWYTNSESWEEKKEEIWISPMTQIITPTENSKKQMTSQQHHQNLWLRIHYGPTEDDQLEKQQLSNWCG